MSILLLFISVSGIVIGVKGGGGGGNSATRVSW